MKKVYGKYFGCIDFCGRIIKTTIINGKIIHNILVDEPITAFGDTRVRILVRDEDLMP
jgi:predicted metalloenzyme YecM